MKHKPTQHLVTNCDHNVQKISCLDAFCTQKRTYEGSPHSNTSGRQEVMTNPQMDVIGNSQIS